MSRLICKAKYPSALGALYGVTVVAHRGVPDNKIILMGREKRTSSLSIERSVSIWDLESGLIHGTCTFDDATQLSVSPARLEEIKRATKVKAG